MAGVLPRPRPPPLLPPTQCRAMSLTFASSELVALSLESVLYGLSHLTHLSSLFISHPHHLIRALRFSVCRLRHRPLQQATAKGHRWREPPSHLGLRDPFHLHNMGSSLLAYLTTFHSYPSNSIWSSMSFVFTSPSIRARQNKERIFSTSA